MPDLRSSRHITMEQVYLGIDLVNPGIHLENGMPTKKAKKKKRQETFSFAS